MATQLDSKLKFKVVNLISFNLKIIEYEDTGEVEYRFYDNPIGCSPDLEEFEENLYFHVEKEKHQPGTFEYVQDIIRSNNESFRRTKQAVYSHARANVWEWFVTYTFDPEKIDSTDYQKVYSSISKHLKNIRLRYCPDMKYIIVPELHLDGKKYHFHALMSNIDGLSFKDSKKRSKGKIIYNIGNYKLGWTTAIRIGEGESAKTANYISKYITKGLTYFTKNRQRYLVSQNLKKPIITNHFISDEEIIDLKKLLHEKTTSAKVAVLNGPYQNRIEYFNLKF